MLNLLEYLNEFLTARGFKPKHRIDSAIKTLRRHNLLNETEYELKKDKVNLTYINFPYPLSWILYLDPEISEKRLRKKLEDLKEDFELIDNHKKYKPKLLRLYSKTFEKQGIKFTKKHLTEHKISLEQIIENAREKAPFLGIAYKTPFGLKVKQYLIENHEGIKHALKHYDKIEIKSKVYKNNAVVLVPSRSRPIKHQVKLFNLPINKNLNPYYDIYRFYTESTTESKTYHDIGGKPNYRILSAIDVSAFFKLIKYLWNTDQRIIHSPILIPNKKFSELIELTNYAITYDIKHKKFRFLNKTEKEIIASLNYGKNEDFKLYSNLKNRNIRYYYDYIK